MQLSDNDIAAIITDRVKRALAASNISQSAIARELDVSDSCVSSWKSGRTEIPTVKLIRLATLLNLSAGDLVPDLRTEAAA